jgi:hypothetical protein
VEHKQLTPSATPPAPKRFRVHLTETRHYHLDVLAASPEQAERVAIDSSDWWVDDNDGGGDVSFSEPVAPDVNWFSPPEKTCPACGRTLTPEELCFDEPTCEDCTEPPAEQQTQC